MARDTSIEAYRAVEACEYVDKTKWEVYTCLYHHGPLTQNEVWTKLGVHTKKDSYGPRFAVLVRMGLIADLGTRTCSISKRSCHFYDVTSTLPTRSVRKVKARKFWIVYSEKSNQLGYASPDKKDVEAMLAHYRRFADAELLPVRVVQA